MLFTEMYTHYTTGEIKTKLLIENFYFWMNMYLLVCENSIVSFHFLIQLLSILLCPLDPKYWRRHHPFVLQRNITSVHVSCE